jgi:Xaa-Pro aminopeptidase
LANDGSGERPEFDRHDTAPGPAKLTASLVVYWKHLPDHPPAKRRAALETLRYAVRSGKEPLRALATVALGDPDAAIAAAAASAYVNARPMTIERRAAAVADVLEWIRRDLALDRAALFAALLSHGDPVVAEQLEGLRLTLTPEETARVRQACRPAACAVVAAFLEEWRQLLYGADD